MKKPEVLIIGSGMGGLVCASLLCKLGYQVCVVERNKQLGGNLQIYVRNKVIFDSGVHYLGGLDKGQNLYQIFKWIGITEHLRLEKMDQAFDRILVGNSRKEYRIMQGYDNFERELLREFPDEEKAVHEYLSTIRSICDRFPLYRLHTGGDTMKKQEAMGISAKKFIESLTQNPVLRAVLAGNNMLYAGSGDDTPLYVHALTTNSYIESAWRCLNGGSQIVQLMAKNILASGGRIIRNREVRKLEMEGEVVKKAILSDGTSVSADYFISNTSPANTYRMTDSARIRPVTRQRMVEQPNTVSSFVLNLVFKRNHFPYLKHNYYYHREGQLWNMENYREEEWPLGYAMYIAPSENSEYARGMTIFAYMRYAEVESWADSFNTVAAKHPRGNGYEEFKNRKREQLLDTVEERFPDLRKAILHSYMSTPLTFRDYIGNQDGNLYGYRKDYRQPVSSMISPKTRISNLFLTGQYLNIHGILGTAISGLQTVMALTGQEEFIEKISHA